MKFAGVLGWQEWQNAMASSEYLWQITKEIRSSKAALIFCNLFYFKMIFIFNTTFTLKNTPFLKKVPKFYKLPMPQNSITHEIRQEHMKTGLR